MRIVSPEKWIKDVPGRWSCKCKGRGVRGNMEYSEKESIKYGLEVSMACSALMWGKNPFPFRSEHGWKQCFSLHMIVQF